VYATSLGYQTGWALIFFRFLAAGLLIFGVAGMALAAMGIYGLVSYTVKQSTREIGIRMALGATRLSVVRGFAGRGVRLGALGAAIGIIGALGVTRLLGSVLFGVTATDPASFARALAIVMGSAVVATIVPAWRAARQNPLRALRHQ
jgi:ABC-type antimicrobial peptide transport system permease subunit